MSEWGSYLLVRTDSDMYDLEVVNQRSESLSSIEELAGGWKVGYYPGPELLDDLPAMLKELAESTGAPCLHAYDLDGACADVHGYASASGYWHAILDRQGWVDFDDEGSDDLHDPDAAVAAAVQWSESAGLTADSEKLQWLFAEAEGDGQAWELVDAMIAALGIKSISASD